MPASGQPLVYLILGAAGSGRRQILADLIEGGLAAGDRPAVVLSDAETSEATDSELPRLGRWQWRDNTILADLPADATHVFFMTDGRGSPVDQAEAFKQWIDAQAAELARVFCIVNCQLVEKSPPLLAWFEACVHFADVVLLTRREGVENKWVSDFLAHFKKKFYPCIFELVKDGRVKNPPLILEPEARRMTHVFDEEQDWVVTNAAGEEIDEDDETTEDEELHAAPEQDPYFERRSDGGRRVKEIPDIRNFLG